MPSSSDRHGMRLVLSSHIHDAPPILSACMLLWTASSRSCIRASSIFVSIWHLTFTRRHSQDKSGLLSRSSRFFKTLESGLLPCKIDLPYPSKSSFCLNQLEYSHASPEPLTTCSVTSSLTRSAGVPRIQYSYCKSQSCCIRLFRSSPTCQFF